MGCNPSGNYPGDKGPPPPVTNIGDDLPVNHVNFIQARNFALRISQITGRKVRLPTEAEWEMACRAGTQTAYYYGNEVAKLSSYAWYGEGSRISHPCGMKLPNACGLYDILGNVWELASDYYETWSTNDPKVDPTGPATGFRRVLRGGCSYNPWDQIRCAMRHPIEETYSDPAIGMRLLCEVD
jgi:formylglycine-generating enzyme required for sulfatase activity